MSSFTAICRLKRVAADNKGDIRSYLPAIPREKNGKRIGLVGAGPASLTVARDLLPLGYHCVLFDGDSKGGGISSVTDSGRRKRGICVRIKCGTRDGRAGHLHRIPGRHWRWSSLPECNRQ
jgi:hypothetical protein